MTCAAARNSAPSSKYNTASEVMTTMSDSALLIGCRCSRRFNAPAMHSPPKMKNKAKCMSFGVVCSTQVFSRPGTTLFYSLLSAISQPQTCRNNIENCNGQQELPAKAHQLVITEARKRSAHPDIKKQEAEDRKQRLDDGTSPCRQKTAEGAGPSTKKEQSGHTAYGNHVRVFGHEEHGELHRTVFSVISGSEFAFCFGQIEGRAVCFRIGRHQIDKEGNKLQSAKDIP